MNMKDLKRRDFITKATIGTFGAAAFISACSTEKKTKTINEPPELSDRAPDGSVIKAGLIGCGGRGTGAAINFLDAGPKLEIVALGDVFQDRIDSCRANLNEKKGVEIADEKCFLGFDSYQKVIDSGDFCAASSVSSEIPFSLAAFMMIGSLGSRYISIWFETRSVSLEIATSLIKSAS